jgi:hypothetical protein
MATFSVEPFRPTPFQASLLLLHLLQTRDEEKDGALSRFRVSELTLKRICCRPRLPDEFLAELQDWMLRAGWALFFADRSYGVIKLEAVEAWTRVGSKRIRDDLARVAQGSFDFAPLASLVRRETSEQED